MKPVHLLSPVPPALPALLAAAGFSAAESALLAISPWPGAPVEPAGPLTVALLASPELAGDALAAGAVAAFCLPQAPDALAALLDPLWAAAQHTDRRIRAMERENRRALAELQSTRDLLGRLIDATPNPVMAVDLRGRVLVFNRAAETALGYDAAWARAHMHVTEVYVDASEARRVLAEIRASPDGLVQGLSARLRARSGEQVPVLLSAAEVHAADGMPIGTVGVFQDRRSELALRLRLEETTGQLIESEKRAATAEVAGAAAHELNQPLTAVMGILEMLELRSDLPEDVAQRLGRATLQLERMADLVRRLAATTRSRTVGYVGQTRILDLSGEGGDS